MRYIWPIHGYNSFNSYHSHLNGPSRLTHKVANVEAHTLCSSVPLVTSTGDTIVSTLDGISAFTSRGETLWRANLVPCRYSTGVVLPDDSLITLSSTGFVKRINKSGIVETLNKLILPNALMRPGPLGLVEENVYFYLRTMGLFCFSLNTGLIRQFDVNEYGQYIEICQGPGFSVIAVTNSHIVFIMSDGTILPKWNLSELGCHNASIYKILSYDNNLNICYTLTTSNDILSLDDKGIKCIVNIGFLATPLAFGSDGSFLVGSGKYLFKYSNAGQQLWAYQLNSRVSTNIAVDTQDYIYFGCMENMIYCLAADGSLVWETKLSNISGQNIFPVGLVISFERLEILVVGKSECGYYSIAIQ